MADATSTFTVRGKADVDDAVRGLNKLGDEAENAGDKAKGMGDYFRATVAGILSAETAMKGLEMVMQAAGAAFDFARDATLEYMQSTAEGRAQVAQFTTEIGKLRTAIGESVVNSEAFGDGFDAAITALQKLTEIMPDVIRVMDNYYLTAVKVEEVTSGFTTAMNTLADAAYNLTPFAAVGNAFELVGTAATNVTEIVGEAEREVRVIADASAAAVAPVNSLSDAFVEMANSISFDAAVQQMTDFFFGVTEDAPEATTAVRGYAAAVDMAAVASEKLKVAQEAGAQAMRDNIEAMNRLDDEYATLLEGFNQAGAEEFARVQERIATEAAAAEAAAIEAKGKIGAALQPGEGEGFGLAGALRKDYDASQEVFGAIGGAAQGLGGALSSGLGAALSSQEKFGKAFKAALGQTLVSLGVSELLTGISNLIPFGPNFNPAAGAARIAVGGSMLAIGKAMGGGGGSAPSGGGGGGGGGRSVGESSGMTPVAQPQRQGPTNLIDYSGVTIVTNDTDSMRTLIDRQSRTAATGGTSRV
jgi:hypothetical protein